MCMGSLLPNSSRAELARARALAGSNLYLAGVNFSGPPFSHLIMNVLEVLQAASSFDH